MACKYQYNNQWYSKEELVNKLSQENSNFKTLYNNLVNEITNTETGRKVFDRIKRDYPIQNQNEADQKTLENLQKITIGSKPIKILSKKLSPHNAWVITALREDGTTFDWVIGTDRFTPESSRDLGAQQEEAIVELLGLMTADKLDKVKDGKLISLLKRLLKEMKQFVRNLLNSKEIYIENLPDNMTLGDIADILAYSNTKLILDGYTVEYTTPDNNKFATYQEASNHISKLFNESKDVNLNNITLPKDVKPVETINEIPVTEFYSDMGNLIKKEYNEWVEYSEGGNFVLKDNQVIKEYNLVNELIKDLSDRKGINNFIEKNKEYEQSKEIIEEWKKVNNIRYNPEEIYSRGQEFSSVVGAYSNFDVNLMMQNLLSHIEDNEKAGGKFAISAYTKPVDKQIGHLEGGGGKIKFKLYPKSEDILWASNIDVYSGSTTISGMSASEAVSNKSPELVGVSFLKYPTLYNISSVQPNLAAIVDDLSHHHNELAISLNFSNFEIEVDEDVPYQTKKIIENVNKILQQKRLEQINNFINKLEKEC